jgi:hypothetical protein
VWRIRSTISEGGQGTRGELELFLLRTNKPLGVVFKLS